MPQSVTELVSRLKQAVEIHVGEQSLIGEIGSCKAASSGHAYFTVKDAKSQLQCVLYRFQAANCPVRLREGLQVELRGRATVWEGRGSLQFIVSHVKEAGQGSLQQQFEALKAKLASEGLFESSRKKALPAWPRSVGLITSASGAVIEDMRHRLESRAPWMRAYLYPAQVQGKGAEQGLAAAIEQWNDPERYNLPPVDYIMLARGGGSLEDLWCFNEEILARAIASSRIPIISAVGHETDFTIADFVADMRAPTPSAAIELSTPDAAQLRGWIDHCEQDIKRKMQRAIETARLRLRLFEQSRLRSPQEAIAPFAQRLDNLEEDISGIMSNRLLLERNRVELMAARISPYSTLQRISASKQQLEQREQWFISQVKHRLVQESSHLDSLRAEIRAASPQNALDRGYALVQNAQGKLLRDSSEIKAGDQVNISLGRGSLNASVSGEGKRALKQ